MRKDSENTYNPGQPALLVTYGNTTRKHRPLERELVVIGRSSCCDIGLVSPEVAPIHCVIVRIADGWRIRDCTGRSGTRVNGKAIHDEMLNDGDTLQVGTFSFQLNLPRGAANERLTPPSTLAPSMAPAAGMAVAPSQLAGNHADERKIKHLKQSRERLARHALNMRRMLREKKAAQVQAANSGAPALEADLNTRKTELEQREKKLRFWEKELTDQDRLLREEYCAVEQQREELEQFAAQSLSRKQVDLEQKIEGILNDRRRALETQAELSIAEQRAELAQSADRLRARERELERERRLLDESASTLHMDKKTELAALEKALHGKQQELEDQVREVEKINAELTEGREALRREFDDAARQREEAQAEIAAQVREAESYLETLIQQAETQRQQLNGAPAPALPSPDLEPLKKELELRARELDAYASHLQKNRDTLTQYEKELSEAYQEFHKEYDQAVLEAQTLKDRAVEEADAIRRGTKPTGNLTDTAHGETKPDDRAAAEELIEELRQEAERIRADLTAQLGEERNRVEKAESQVKYLKIDLTEQRNELRQREEILEHLKAELKLREEQLRPPSHNGEVVMAAPERLMRLVEKLQKDVAERDGRIREMRKNMENMQLLSDPSERQGYEEELNRYRVELEQDRALLNEEIAQVQVFRAEVEETRNEMELHISHDRVEIAREWAEINRVRDQLRFEHSKQDQLGNAAHERAANMKKTTKTEAVVDLPPEPAPPPPSDLISRLGPRTRNGL